MATKKVFTVKEKVFARVRGYPPWPAIITGIKSGTPAQLRYEVYFYGTGEHAICKPENIFSYVENKTKLGIPKKLKYFNEALLQIENNIMDLVVPQNDEPYAESEVKLNEERNSSKVGQVVTLNKSLGLPAPKEKKRKIIDVKPEPSFKKFISNKLQSSENLKIEEGQIAAMMGKFKVSKIEKAIPRANPDAESNNKDAYVNKKKSATKFKDLKTVNNKTAEMSDSIAENTNKKVNVDEQQSETTIKDSETINITKSIFKASDVLKDNTAAAKTVPVVNDVNIKVSSSKSSNLEQVSKLGCKSKQEMYSDSTQNVDAEVPKYPVSRNENSKTIKDSNIASSSVKNCAVIEIDSSLEQSFKTEDTSSNPKISHELVQYLNNNAKSKIDKLLDKLKNDNELPFDMKTMIANIATNFKGREVYLQISYDILKVESDMLGSLQKLHFALKVDQPNYETALKLLSNFRKFEPTAFMLKKNQEIVESLIKVSNYIPCANKLSKSKDDMNEDLEKASQIRRHAKIVLNKYASLFTIPKGQSFKNIFDKEVEDFCTKTKNMCPEEKALLISDKCFK